MSRRAALMAVHAYRSGGSTAAGNGGGGDVGGGVVIDPPVADPIYVYKLNEGAATDESLVASPSDPMAVTDQKTIAMVVRVNSSGSIRPDLMGMWNNGDGVDTTKQGWHLDWNDGSIDPTGVAIVQRGAEYSSYMKRSWDGALAADTLSIIVFRYSGRTDPSGYALFEGGVKLTPRDSGDLFFFHGDQPAPAAGGAFRLGSDAATNAQEAEIDIAQVVMWDSLLTDAECISISNAGTDADLASVVAGASHQWRVAVTDGPDIADSIGSVTMQGVNTNGDEVALE